MSKVRFSLQKEENHIFNEVPKRFCSVERFVTTKIIFLVIESNEKILIFLNEFTKSRNVLDF